MGMIFVSHSSQDQACTAQLAAALKEKGYESLFLDFDPEAGIRAGELWQAALYRKLRSCGVLLALITDHYLESQWCFAEVALARMQGKHLFGILAPPLAANPKLPALFSDHQLADGRDNFGAAVERVVKGMAAAGLGPGDFRSWQRGRAPYPGFAAFDEGDAAVFFGRDQEIERGLEMVRGSVRGTASRMGLLLGSSGSGKSSLLRAGIVPRLRREDGLVLVGPFRPGPEPLDELAWQVADAFGIGVEKLDTLRSAQPDVTVSLDRLVRQLLREHAPRGQHALFLVDQFEELLGRPPDHPSHAVLSLLQRALQNPEGCLSVLATLRSDQLGHLQGHPAAQDLEPQTLLIGPLDASTLRAVIEEPARLAELELEPGLTERLVADTIGPEALPLLALTLRRLWEVGGGDGLLQIEEYRQLGGIQGAVARVAEDALAGITGEDRLQPLRDALLKMVRLDENGNAVRQPLRWEDTPEVARPLLDRFVKSRLLIRERDDIRVAHEALFGAWSQLRGWIDQHREALVVQQQISQAANLWREGQDESDLWRGARLDRALEFQQAGELVLGVADSSFLAASRDCEQTARQEKIRRDRERERLSRVALGRGLAYQALAESQDRPQRGILLAVEAARTTSESGLGVTPVAESALRELLCRFGGEAVGSFDARVRCLAFDGKGRLAAGCHDGTVGLLTLDGASGPKVWRARQAESPIVEVMAAGQRVLARSEDGAVRVWEMDGAAREFRPSNAGKAAALGPGGRLLAIAGEGEDLLVHDVETAAHYRLKLQAAPIRALAFSPDGRWLADGRDNGDLILWDLSTITGRPSAMSIHAHPGAVTRIVWAAEAPCFVTCGADHNLRRWAFGQNPGDFEVAEMAGSGSSILDLAVSGKGDVVAAGTWHSETLCWLADDSFAQPVVLTGHSSSVGSVAIRNDGAWLATACPRDHFALLWPVDGLRENPAPHRVQGAERWLEAVRFAPDGSIVSGDWGGQVRCWRNLAEEPWEMPIPGVDLNRYALARDGSLLIAAGAQVAVGSSPDRRAKLVSLTERHMEPVEDPSTAAAVAMTPDGRVSVIGSEEGVISVRDRISGTERKLGFPMDGWFGSLTVDPAGRWLLAANKEGATLLDVSSEFGGEGVRLIQGFLAHAVFDDSGERLLIAHQGEVTVWNRAAGGFAPGPVYAHDRVKWCAFLPGGGWVSGSEETLQLTDPDRGFASLLLPYGRKTDSPRFAVSRSAGRVVVAGNVQVTSWDLACDDPAASRLDLPRHEGFIQTVAVSEDGTRIATSMVDGPVRLWDAAAPLNVVALPQSTRSVMLLAFLDSGRKLMTGDSYRSLAVWDLDAASMMERARRVAGREFTAEERSRFLEL